MKKKIEIIKVMEINNKSIMIIFIWKLSIIGL